MGKESNARTTLIKVVVTCLVVALSFGIIFIGEYTIGPDEDTAEQTATADLNFTPGTYTATAPGMESDVEVTATFDEDSITDVSIDVSGETAGIGAEVGDEMTQQFLAAQSASVDGVSGASVTSGALKEAMQDCIDQASGGSEEAAEAETGEETEAAAEEAAEAEEMTEAAAEEAAEPAPEEAAEEIGEAAAGIAAVEGAAEEEAAAPAAEEASAGGSYTPGTYTATAQGINGEILVSVTFTENAIVSIGSDLSCETEDIGGAIGPDISKQILDAQSTDVDGVSGATITSDAFKSAVEECISEASSGSAAAEGEAEAPVSQEEAAAPAAEEASAGGSYTPGTYTATAQGINGEILVSVAFTENTIVSIGSDLSCETEDIGGAIGPDISKQILDAQSADVDGVSGATITSDAFKSAVEECISEASSGSAAAEGEAEEPTAEEEAAAPAAEEEAEAPAAEAGSTGGSYTPGTYSAQAQGISSAVTVTLSFDENSILSAGCDVSGETEDIGGAIGPEVCAQILDAQSAEIDGVSGASITSDAVKEAAAECIAIARGEE